MFIYSCLKAKIRYRVCKFMRSEKASQHALHLGVYCYGKINLELCEVYRRAILARNSTALRYHISLANTKSLSLILDVKASNSIHILSWFS